MGKPAQRAGHLRTHFRIGVRAERGERLAQRRLLQPPREFDEARQPGIVQPAEQLLQVPQHGGPRPPEHAGVVGLDRGPQERQLLERRRHEDGAPQALERRGGGELDGGMRVAQQPQHPADVVGRRGDRQKARALEPLPPARRAIVGPHDPRPPLVLERPRQLLPRPARHPGGPVDERLDRERHGQTRQCAQHLVGGGPPQRPALHHRVELEPARVHLRAAPQADPPIQDDQDHQGDEQHPLGGGGDEQKIATRHLPTQRLIFSSATRRLIGFTR